MTGVLVSTVLAGLAGVALALVLLWRPGRCDWTRLPATACRHCSPERPVPAEGSVSGSSAVAAAPARCPRCECWVWAGDRIGLDGGVWVCGECAA